MMTQPYKGLPTLTGPTATDRARWIAGPPSFLGVASPRGYAPPPIGAAGSAVTGRPTTTYAVLEYAQGSSRPGQRLTVLPVAYVPSVSSIGTSTTTAGAKLGTGVPWMWLAVGLVALVAGAYLVRGR
jgi:hypothetical protein